MIALVSSAAVVITSCGTDRAPTATPTSEASSGPTSLRYRHDVFADVEVISDVPYQSAPALALDVYQPSGDTSTKRPAVIWMHGGGFAAGNKSEGVFIDFPTAFAKLGYVAVSIDYRLLVREQCIEPFLESQQCADAASAATEDAQTAVRFLRANATIYGIDPTRIAVAGESAGAIAATGVGIHAHDDRDRVQAWVSFSGGAKNGDGVDGNDSPGLLIAGTADPLVPFAWSSAVEAALEAAGVPVELRPLDGPLHVPVDQFRQLMLDDSRDFLYEHLDLASAEQ